MSDWDTVNSIHDQKLFMFVNQFCEMDLKAIGWQMLYLV